MDDSTVPVSLKLPAGLVARIDAASVAEDRSRTATVRRVLMQAFSDDAALRAMAARRFESLTNPAGGVLLPDRRPGGTEGFGPDRAAATAPVAARTGSSAGAARAGAATISPHEDIAMTAHEQAIADDQALRARAVADPHRRPNGGAVDTATTAPGQDAARAERQRLAEFHSRPAPKG